MSQRAREAQDEDRDEQRHDHVVAVHDDRPRERHRHREEHGGHVGASAARPVAAGHECRERRREQRDDPHGDAEPVRVGGQVAGVPGQPEDGHGQRRVLDFERLREGALAVGHALRVFLVDVDVADVVQPVPQVGEQEDEHERGEDDAHDDGARDAGLVSCSRRGDGVHWPRKLHSLLTTKLKGSTQAIARSWLTMTCRSSCARNTQNASSLSARPQRLTVEELEELGAHRPRGAEGPPAVQQVVVDHGDREGQAAGEGLDGERRAVVELAPHHQRELEDGEVDDGADGADHGELHELLAAPVETFVHEPPGSRHKERPRGAAAPAARPEDRGHDMRWAAGQKPGRRPAWRGAAGQKPARRLSAPRRPGVDLATTRSRSRPAAATRGPRRRSARRGGRART